MLLQILHAIGMFLPKTNIILPLGFDVQIN